MPVALEVAQCSANSGVRSGCDRTTTVGGDSGGATTELVVVVDIVGGDSSCSVSGRC